MASSKKPHPEPAHNDELVSFVESVLGKRVSPNQHLTLGLSGGLDSVVLLDLLIRLRSRLPFRLSALHVNHQISPHSGRWADFCRDLCERHAVELTVVKIKLPGQTGESLEAQARAARYAEFERCAADWIVLAQHLDDQAETLLLQLLRGCGVDGASAMGESRRRFLRPLLDISRRALSEHAQANKLEWVEDESNQDARFDRNFLRHQIFPLLEQRFPAYRDTLARSARNFAQSKRLQDEVARLDGLASIHDNRLDTPILSQLSDSRARNLLRYFLKRHAIPAPSETMLQEMLQQLLTARQDAGIRIPLGALSLRRFQNQAWLVHDGHDEPSPHFVKLTLTSLVQRSASQIMGCLSATRFAPLQPASGKTLALRPTQGQGISLKKLGKGVLSVQSRVGGEKLRPDCQRPSRTLKHLLQEAGIPPWERSEHWLLYCDDKLVAVTGIGIDCAFQASSEEPGLALEWISAKRLASPIPDGVEPDGDEC